MTDQTPEVRQRTRAPIQPTAQQPQGRVPQGQQQQNQQPFMHRGPDAAQHRQRELERQEQRRANGYAPFRYWLPVGSQGDIIILDNELGPCFYEHAVPGPNNDWKNVTHELCPKEYDTCPLCAGQSGQKESYYVMFLSIIDLRPFTKRDGAVVPWSRKLLAIKAQQQNYFVRLLDRCSHNLRGAHLLMTRDTQQTFNVGQGEYIRSYEEADLVTSFSHPAVTGQDGRVMKQANADMFPYDYEQLFQRPTGEDLRRRYGGVAPAGSSSETNDTWGGTDPAAQAPAAHQPGQSILPQATQPAQTAAPAPAPQGGIQPMARPSAGGAQVGANLDDEIPFS